MRPAILLGLVFLLLAPVSAGAQTLDEVVNGVESTYGKIVDLRAEFTQTARNKSLGQDIKADGTGRPVLDLTPKQPTPLLTRLVITVDPKDYVVRQAVLYDQFQNTVTMTFNKVAINPGISDTLFVFTPPKDAAVVPLDPR